MVKGALADLHILDSSQYSQQITAPQLRGEVPFSICNWRIRSQLAKRISLLVIACPFGFSRGMALSAGRSSIAAGNDFSPSQQ